MDAPHSDTLPTRKLSRRSTRRSQRSFYSHLRRSSVRVVCATFHVAVGWLPAGLSICYYFCRPRSTSSIRTVATTMPRTSITMRMESQWKVRRVYHRGLDIWFGISKCAFCSYTSAHILNGSHHRVLVKIGSVLSAVEGLSYKSPRDVTLLGNPLKKVRAECVVRNTITYGYGTRRSDIPFFIPSFSLLQEIFRIPAGELDRAYSEDIEALEERC